MKNKELHQGKIEFYPAQNKKKAFKYNLEVPCPEVSDTLMNQFRGLGLSEEEKRDLTLNHRKKIFFFQNLKTQQIVKNSNQFIKELKKYKDENLVIKASGEAAYICLAAIYSGKVPAHTNWKFELSSVPLGLFPKELVKTEASRVDICLELQKDCWLKPFKTLYSAPKFLGHLQDENHQELIAA